MGLWCTVFGHDWGEPEIERDRREEGEEVVVTVREIKICDRCGGEEVLGESVEVTAIEPARTGQSGSRDHGSGSTDPEQEPGPSDDPLSAGDDPGADRYDDPATDDGIVLEGSNHDSTPLTDASRQPGEWPDRPEREGADSGLDGEPRPWPDPEAGNRRDAEPEESGWVDTLSGAKTEKSGGDEIADEQVTDEEVHGDGSDAGEPSGDTGEPSGDTGEPSGDTGEPSGDAPEPDDWNSPVGGVFPGERPEDDAEVLDATEPNEQSRVTAAEPADPASDPASPASDPTDPASDTDEPDRAGGACYCPECGFVHDQPNPSFRGGDVCPNCRRSYLAEREE